MGFVLLVDMELERDVLKKEFRCWVDRDGRNVQFARFLTARMVIITIIIMMFPDEERRTKKFNWKTKYLQERNVFKRKNTFGKLNNVLKTQKTIKETKGNQEKSSKGKAKKEKCSLKGFNVENLFVVHDLLHEDRPFLKMNRKNPFKCLLCGSLLSLSYPLQARCVSDNLLSSLFH